MGFAYAQPILRCYPVIKFSEVPEIFCELVDPLSDNPPLGIGEATGAPTVAAIGNAVAQALGIRLRPADDARAGYGGVVEDVDIIPFRSAYSIIDLRMI